MKTRTYYLSKDLFYRDLLVYRTIENRKIAVGYDGDVKLWYITKL